MNFHLRPFTLDDLPTLVRHANNREIARNLTDKFPFPYTVQSGKIFLNMVIRKDPPNVLAIEIEGKASGAIGIHPQEDIFCKNAELGYWLAQAYWKQGIMSRAIPQMVTYGFENWAIDRIFARPFGSNIGSQKALEKAGFTLEAKFEKTLFKWGRYEDEYVYAIRRPAYAPE